MKKLIAFVLVFVLSQQAFACVCAYEISASFSAFDSSVKTELDRHSEAIRTHNIKEAKVANKLLEEKIKQLAELIEKEKQDSVKREEIIFNLRKKINLLGK